MTRDAIDAIGGMEVVVDEGDVVFIKPNFVTIPWVSVFNCFQMGECTKPEILIAAAEECLKAGAAEVIIGDGSHWPSWDWKHVVTLEGSTNLEAEAARLSSLYDGKVTLVCLEVDSPDWIEIPSTSYHDVIAVSSLVANADKVISIPVAKSHFNADLSLASKNFIGITPNSRYGKLVANDTFWNRSFLDHSSPTALSQVFLDIVKGIQVDLAIIDFSIGVEGNGPSLSMGGETLNIKDRLGTWAVVASTDIMAADATAARMMSHDVDEVAQLGLGYDMGLGEIRKDSIEILSNTTLDNLIMEWKPAVIRSYPPATSMLHRGKKFARHA
jgi:uncharacterized protein (DUF362 family)